MADTDAIMVRCSGGQYYALKGDPADPQPFGQRMGALNYKGDPIALGEGSTLYLSSGDGVRWEPEMKMDGVLLIE